MHRGNFINVSSHFLPGSPPLLSPAPRAQIVCEAMRSYARVGQCMAKLGLGWKEEEARERQVNGDMVGLCIGCVVLSLHPLSQFKSPALLLHFFHLLHEEEEGALDSVLTGKAWIKAWSMAFCWPHLLPFIQFLYIYIYI